MHTGHTHHSRGAIPSVAETCIYVYSTPSVIVDLASLYL